MVKQNSQMIIFFNFTNKWQSKNLKLMRKSTETAKSCHLFELHHEWKLHKQKFKSNKNQSQKFNCLNLSNIIQVDEQISLN